MAARQFVHHAATPGLILTIEDGKIVSGKAFGSFSATIYVREKNAPGFTNVNVEAVQDFVAFDDLLTSEPEPAAPVYFVDPDDPTEGADAFVLVPPVAPPESLLVDARGEPLVPPAVVVEPEPIVVQEEAAPVVEPEPVTFPSRLSAPAVEVAEPPA